MGTNNQFIVDYGVFPNPTDTNTLKPFLKSHLERYGSLPGVVVADSSYGCEENYQYMDENGVKACVKYPNFDRERHGGFSPDPFLPENFPRDDSGDCLVCPNGRRMRHVGKYNRKTATGYVVECDTYEAEDCSGCPLRERCFSGERKKDGNRRFSHTAGAGAADIDGGDPPHGQEMHRA